MPPPGDATGSGYGTRRKKLRPAATVASQPSLSLDCRTSSAKAQRKKLLLDFLAPIIARHGVAADVAIHTAHDDRNIHAHVLLTHRELGADGFGEIANPRTIRKKVKGQVKLIGITGIAATPADVEAIRKSWAAAVNRAYALAGLDIRVDHRSFERRGIEDVPTIHLGPKASAMERRQLGSSDRGDINRGIELHNAHRRKLRQLRAAGRRMMQRQAQPSPRGGEIRAPVTPRAPEFLVRPEIASEARQAPKRPDHANVSRRSSTPISGFPRGP